ncbi:MAG: nucleoside hydrolase [Anaerocolumna sp.]
MSGFITMEEDIRVRMLKYPEGKIDIVLDTDAATEVDDQFAIAYALLSEERLRIRAIHAAPFAMNERAKDPKQGMEMSYQEILHIMKLIKVEKENLVFRGSAQYLSDKNKPVQSEAAENLIKIAKEYSPDKPLYVVCIGAATNVASAVLLEPEIIRNMVVVWLAGNDIDESPNVYNIYQDIKSAQVIFDCGVPLIHIPCNYVASHMLIGIPELETSIGGKNRLCDYLIDIVKAYGRNHYAWSKQIWDIAVIGYLMQENWAKSEWISSPVLTDNITWSKDYSRHLIKNVKEIKRDIIFRDMFHKFCGI